MQLLNIKDLKVGDEFWECEYGINAHYRVVEAPQYYPPEAENEDGYANGWATKAEFLGETVLTIENGERVTEDVDLDKMQTGKITDFFTNDSYSGYIRIYAEPQYISFKG